MIKFTDVRPTFNGSSTHCSPNEHLPSLRKLTEGMLIEPVHGGSIASGGEVPLTVILPLISGNLKVVDHNYGSLWWTHMKILLLEKFSNAELKALWAKPGSDIKAALDRLDPENCITIAGKLEKKLDFTHWTESSWQSLAQFWQKEIPLSILNKVRDKLPKVELIHGDLRDLGTDLDIIYISNALGHSPFDASTMDGKTYVGRRNLEAQLASIVSVGGLVLSTGGGAPELALAKSFEFKGSMTWTYELYRRTLPTKVVTKRFQYMIPEKKRLMISRVDAYGYQYAEYWKPKFIPGKVVRNQHATV